MDPDLLFGQGEPLPLGDYDPLNGAGFVPPAPPPAKGASGIEIAPAYQAPAPIAEIDPVTGQPVQSAPHVPVAPLSPALPQGALFEVGMRDAAREAAMRSSAGGYNAEGRAAVGMNVELAQDSARLRREQAAKDEQAGQQIASTYDQQAAQTQATVDKLNEAEAAEKAKQEEIAFKQEAFAKESRATQLEYDRAAKDLNPQRLLGGVGNKIAFLFAAAAGGFTAGLNGGGPNRVMDTMLAMLDADYANQRDKLAAVKERKSFYMEQEANLRQKGLDQQSAYHANRAAMINTLSKQAEVFAKNAQSVEAKNAYSQMAMQGYVKANEELQRGADAIVSTVGKIPAGAGSAPVSTLDVIEQAQRLSANQEKIRQSEMASQVAFNKGNAEPGTDLKAADKNRQSKLGEKYAPSRAAMEQVDGFIQQVESGKIGPVDLRFPNASSSQELARQADMWVVKMAKSFGAAITASDLEQANKLVGDLKASASNPTSWSNGVMANKLRAIHALFDNARKESLRGMRPEDQEAVRKSYEYAIDQERKGKK